MPKSEVHPQDQLPHVFHCYLCGVHSKVPLSVCPISVKGT